MKTANVRCLGIIISLVTFTSLILPWWSIRASRANIDVYPFSVRALNVWSQDWVVDRLLTLDSSLLVVGLLVVASGILSLTGSLKLPPLVITPLALNLTAAFLFYEVMRSAIGELAHGPFSGTNLIPVGPWGFAIGIGLCALAGLASPAPFILCYLNYANQNRRVAG